MSTVIKSWKAQHPEQDGVTLHALVVACDAGMHYHLVLQEERQYETLDDAGHHLGRALTEAAVLYGLSEWVDDTGAWEDNSCQT